MSPKADTPEEHNKNKSSYTIGAAARLTGLSTQLIRAWEQRYGAVVAARSENGRRYYSASDVEKLGLLKTLTDRGIAISSIAGLDQASLLERLNEADQVALKPLDGKVRVAVLGEGLAEAIKHDVMPANPVELVARGVDVEQFMADTRGLAPDVLLIETSSLSTNSKDWLESIKKTTGAGEVMVAYGFARSEDEQAIADAGFRLLRTPLSTDELAVGVLAAAVNLRCGEHFNTPAEPVKGVTRPAVDIPPRRFTGAQLATLGRIESNVDCECPNHMAQVVQTLSAFESYCAQCEDRSPEDAALHAYLHRSTAQARAMMEVALAHLAEEEGLSVE